MINHLFLTSILLFHFIDNCSLWRRSDAEFKLSILLTHGTSFYASHVPCEESQVYDL